MFFTLMAVFLIGSTAGYSDAHGETTQNCSETRQIRKQGSLQTYQFKETDKVVCFKADSGRVHLQLNCDYGDDLDCFMHHRFKCCEPPVFDVYDGCNATAEKVEITSDCKDFHWRGMKWMSKKTSCLKVVWRKQHFRQSVCVWYGKAYRQDFRHCSPCSKSRRRSKVFIRWRPLPPYRWSKPRPPGSRQPRRNPPPTGRRQPRPVVKTTKPPPAIPTVFQYNSLRGTIEFPNSTAERRLSKVEYTYKIILPDENKRIRLIFKRVNLSTHQPCDSDYIAIYDGHVTWAKMEDKFCENKYTKKPFISRSNSLKIKFVAKLGKDAKQKGFNVTYEPYEASPDRHYTNNKVTGVVIGTACGLVFLALTFLAICHSRRLILLHFVQEHDADLNCGSDVIQEKAPPSYDDVMASPEKYPVTPFSKRKERHPHEPPPYPGLLYPEELVHNVPSYDVPNDASTDVERGARMHETEASDENESQHRDVAEMDAGAESDVRESDVGGTDVKESEENHDEGDEEKKENDTSQKYLGIDQSYAGIGVSLSQSKSHKLTSEEYSRAITTDV